MSTTHRLKQHLPSSLRRRLGSLRRRVRALPGRTNRQKKRLLHDSSLSDLQRELLSRTSSRIFFNDGMYTGDGAHYFRVGLSAISCIDEAIERASVNKVHHILDLPSGGGRVLRFLVQRFPDAKVTACDLQREAVDFCAETLGALPFYSQADFATLSLGKSFELIWCGSLVTHLNRTEIGALLEFFKRHLAPGALLVFTTMGDYVARERLPGRNFDYGLADEQISVVIADYERSGFGFAGYAEGIYDISETCGVTLTSPEWIREQARQVGGLREVYFAERGWDAHQDVFGFVREG